MRNPSMFLGRNSDIQIQDSFFFFSFPHHWIHFLSRKPFLSSSFFYILFQRRAYLLYTPFIYIMSLSLIANLKRTWILELLLYSWENTMLPADRGRVLLWELSCGEMPRVIVQALHCQELDRTQKNNARGSERCDWPEKIPPITRAKGL